MTGLGAWLFGVDQHLTVGQECARAILVFVYGFVLVRFAGKRLFGNWSAIDIAVSIIVGSNLSRAITGDAALVGTLAASTLLLALHWLLAHWSARSRAASRLLEGQPVDIVRDGRIDEARRRAHNVSKADLDEALRRAGLDGVEQVERLTIEPSGRITLKACGGVTR